MKLSAEEFRDAIGIIGEAGGAEAAIVAQFALDLAVAAHFTRKGRPIEPAMARHLLRLRLARHRAKYIHSSGVIH